ncbi:MAG: hypothetical protein EOO38_15790 [Cytophagaceae bacterium]|nr:MAG: hypothetical protein EOO38_15790 [Cytophagaceae bacterium]
MSISGYDYVVTYLNKATTISKVRFFDRVNCGMLAIARPYEIVTMVLVNQVRGPPLALVYYRAWLSEPDY